MMEREHELFRLIVSVFAGVVVGAFASSTIGVPLPVATASAAISTGITLGILRAINDP
jgi:carbon starvation protein CstA